MHNVEFLEKQWLKLKLKKLLFKIVFTLLIIVTLSITFSFIYLKVDFQELKGLIEFKKEKEEVKSKVITPPIPTATPIPTIEEESAPIYKDIIEEEKIIDKKIKSQPQTQIVSISKTQKDFLTILKEKFLKNPNYKIAISIAEEYYKKENFEEALNWSIRANELDDKKDESWLIFANSKEKLNKLDEAINALKIYLTKNSSTKIQELLNKLIKQKEIHTPTPTIVPKVEKKEQKDIVKIEKKESKKDILAKIKVIKKAYYTYPNAKDALSLVKEYVEIENYKNCMFWAEKLIEHLPNNEAGYIYYGTCAPKERFFTKSIKLLQNYLKKEPKNEKIKSLIEKVKEQRDRG